MRFRRLRSSVAFEVSIALLVQLTFDRASIFYTTGYIYQLHTIANHHDWTLAQWYTSGIWPAVPQLIVNDLNPCVPFPRIDPTLYSGSEVLAHALSRLRTSISRTEFPFEVPTISRPYFIATPA